MLKITSSTLYAQNEPINPSTYSVTGEVSGFNIKKLCRCFESSHQTAYSVRTPIARANQNTSSKLNNTEISTGTRKSNMNEQEIRDQINEQTHTNHLSAIDILREKFRRESLQRLEIQIFLTRSTIRTGEIHR